MEALERDYNTVLLVNHEPPCLSLYQPTHRSHPGRQQDTIRFRNLVKELELSMRRKHAGRDSTPVLRPFRDLAEDAAFWNHALDGFAVFATPDLFKVYRLRRPVPESWRSSPTASIRSRSCASCNRRIATTSSG